MLTVTLVLATELAEDDVDDAIDGEPVSLAPAAPHPDSAKQITIAGSGRIAQKGATPNQRSQNTFVPNRTKTAGAATLAAVCGL